MASSYALQLYRVALVPAHIIVTYEAASQTHRVLEVFSFQSLTSQWNLLEKLNFGTPCVLLTSISPVAREFPLREAQYHVELKVYESPLKTGVYKVTLYGYIPEARSILASALELAWNRRTPPLGTILFSYLFTLSHPAAVPPLWRLVSSVRTPTIYTNTSL
jgi:hypothetical protein